jgi:hypothetical protein
MQRESAHQDMRRSEKWSGTARADYAVTQGGEWCCEWQKAAACRRRVAGKKNLCGQVSRYAKGKKLLSASRRRWLHRHKIARQNDLSGENDRFSY